MTICSERISSYLGRGLAGDRLRSSYYKGVKPANNQDVQELEVSNFDIDLHNILI